jgi:hypothetical protein
MNMSSEFTDGTGSPNLSATGACAAAVSALAPPLGALAPPAAPALPLLAPPGAGAAGALAPAPLPALPLGALGAVPPLGALGAARPPAQPASTAASSNGAIRRTIRSLIVSLPLRVTSPGARWYTTAAGRAAADLTP